MSKRVQPAAIAARCLPVVLLWLLLAAPTWAQITPYLQTPTGNSIWITWKTASGTQSLVEYGLSPGALDQSASGTNQLLGTDYNYHSVHLTGLIPDTTYHYRTITGAETSQIETFRTPPATGTHSGHFRILVMGDHQIRNEQRYIQLVTRARAKLESMYGTSVEQAVNIVLNVGDQVDVGTLDHYENLHFAQSAPISPNLPIQTAVGNHETYYDPGLALYRAHFHYENIVYQGITPPDGDAYYALQVANVLLLYLNSEDPSTTQTDWVRDVIAAASGDASVEWIISLSHRPYQAEQYVGDISGWLRDTVMPILASTPKHVLNIGAHHHLYARGQTTDWPMYHIISGGTAWDQFWGQSTERDFSDVEKTVANWAWQIIDIDLDAREMVVESYAEAHPKLGFVYDSQLIDRFHRKLDMGPPNQPSIVNNDLGAALDLSQPFTFESSAFSSLFGETLNSAQFQVASDVNFNTIRLDQTQAVVNWYGDTGAPIYEPTDIGLGSAATTLTLEPLALANGDYFIRVRHRDNNTLWSDWSVARSFSVTGSRDGDPTLFVAGQFATGSAVPVFYEHAARANPTWIGIYREGQNPGAGVGASAYHYPLTAASGQVSLGPLTKNDQYYAVMFEHLGGTSHVEVSPRVSFFYGDIPTLALANTADIEVGDTVSVTWAGSPGNARDWIGIYRVGDEPGSTQATAFAYAPAGSGSVDFASLPKGYYFAAMFVNDTYTQIGERISFAVNDPNAPIASASLSAASFQAGETVDFSFSDGPGTPKDYIGIFEAGAIPGIDLLVTYIYVDGSASGSITIDEDLPPGDYYAALYINDSYTAVSNPVNFSVLPSNDAGDAVQVPLPVSAAALLALMLALAGAGAVRARRR